MPARCSPMSNPCPVIGCTLPRTHTTPCVIGEVVDGADPSLAIYLTDETNTDAHPVRHLYCVHGRHSTTICPHCNNQWR